MTGFALIAAATIGILGADGQPPADAARVAQVLGYEADTVRAIGLDAQLQPWWAVGARIAPCTQMAGRDLDQAVSDADAKLADLEAGAAVGILAEAVGAAHCTEDWVEPQALKVALESWGHAAQQAGDETAARAAYEQLAASDPGWRIRPPPGSGFEELWDTVRSGLAGQALVTLAVHGGSREVRLDGVALTAPTARIEAAPGRHLLQWTAPDGLVLGAWVVLSSRAPRAAFVTSLRPDAISLLATGEQTEAGRAALEVWLDALRSAHGLAEIVVVTAEKPWAGYRIAGPGLVPWSADLRSDFTMSPDRARVLVGGGWLTTSASGDGGIGAFHHADARLTLDVKVIGPLHVTVDAEVATSTISYPGSDLDGSAVLLPGFGAGIALRKPLGLLQPWFGVNAGLWITTSSDTVDDAVQQGPMHQGSQIGNPDSPVTLRLFAEGGVDLVPAGGPMVVRIAAGAGYGLGFQARAGVLVGARFGN